MDGSITSSLDSELLDLMELPLLPDLDEKNITSAQLELTDGTVRQLTSAVETRETEVETETGETDENREPIYETTTETEESLATCSSAVTLTVQLASARTALPLLRSTS